MAAQCLPDTQFAVGAAQNFATHAQLARYGFAWGVSDGNFGAIPAGAGKYTFYGAGGSASLTPPEGVYAFTGTLSKVLGANTTTKLFGPRSGPAGWVFDRDYAGGGMVVRFDDRKGHAGWLMSFHGEYHWRNTSNPPKDWCFVGNTRSQVPCFYSGLGLAVSLDNGKTFRVVGQTMQPTQPLSTFVNGGTNMDVGYGSLLVADRDGNHLPNPPPDPEEAYFYLVFADKLPASATNVGVCANALCTGVARARYDHVIRAALSGKPDEVAKAFHKYDTSAEPWSQAATSGTPDLSGTAGSFRPLWTDEVAPEGSVIYDERFNVYLAVYQHGAAGVRVRASRDLIHWTGTVATIVPPASSIYYYPTLIGDTEGDPTIGGGMPRVYFSSFPVNAFPNYSKATFEYVQLSLSGTKDGCAP